MSNACQHCGAALSADHAVCDACGVPSIAAAPGAAPAAASFDAAIARRARVLRDASAGDGLLSADGRQYPFSLESHWRSDVAPAVNMAVDARFSPAGELIDVRAVSEAAQQQETLNAAVNEAREVATHTLARLRSTGAPVATAFVGRVGYANLAAIALLALGWFAFDTISIRITSVSSIGLTFYDMLRALHSMNDIAGLEGATRGSAGFYGLLAWASLALCVAPFFVDARRLWLGLASPLAFGLAVAAGLYWKISTAMSALAGGNDEVSQLASGYARELAAEMFKALSFGFGFYLALAASVFLAVRGVMRYRAK
ncbi:hypothetical protein [Paraburkholderia lycopersici]|uniref:Uncharacterized protein n=1 Tax=Paraburkholderia lycopersici TaxID=416944 RepID=A0A1G7CL40_9BURK|nr:hypothetical protein [Paraburkholderia lycopersici]SDE39941.1 hypothetical protein SAMN05421548_14615 [Paraburkholderia lycopersici]